MSAIKPRHSGKFIAYHEDLHSPIPISSMEAPYVLSCSNANSYKALRRSIATFPSYC